MNVGLHTSTLYHSELRMRSLKSQLSRRAVAEMETGKSDTGVDPDAENVVTQEVEPEVADSQAV
jgi:hypothetical protein